MDTPSFNFPHPNLIVMQDVNNPDTLYALERDDNKIIFKMAPHNSDEWETIPMSPALEVLSVFVFSLLAQNMRLQNRFNQLFRTSTN